MVKNTKKPRHYDAIKKDEKPEIKKAETKKSGSEKRQKNLFIRGRVSEAEKAEVLEKLEKLNMTEGEFVRSRCLNAPTTRAARRPSVETATLAKLLGELGKIGSNLNQIAHRLNMDGAASPPDIADALKELRKVGVSIIEATGRKAGKNDNQGSE